MHLLALSLLAIVNLSSWKYACSLKDGLVAYTADLSKLPVQSAYTQGYARYIDNNGVQRLIAYTYPKPFYQIGQPTVSYVKSALLAGAPVVGKTIGSVVTPNQQNTASESHFLNWAQQQYQALKTDVDTLRNAGKQPSANMIEKLLALEKIATASDFASIREQPDVKLIREEHLRLWNEAASKTLHANVNAQSPIYIKSLGEILGQKLAPYGSHLLLQNPQIAGLKQLQVNHLHDRNQAPLSKILYYGVGQNVPQQQQSVAGVQEQLLLWNAHSNRKPSEVHSLDVHHHIRAGDTVTQPQVVQVGADYLQQSLPDNRLGVKNPFNGGQSFGQHVLYGAPSHINYNTNSASGIHNKNKSVVPNAPLFGNKVFQGVLSNTQYQPSIVIDDYNNLKSSSIQGQIAGQQVTLLADSKLPYNAEYAFVGSHSVAQQPVPDLKSTSHYADDVRVQNYHDVNSDFNRGGQSVSEPGVGQPSNNYGTHLVHLEMPSTYQELLKHHTSESHPESDADFVSAGEYATKQQTGEPHEQKTYVIDSGVSDGHYGVKSFITPEHNVHHSNVRHPISTLPTGTYNPHASIASNYNRKALDTSHPSTGQHETSQQIYNANKNLHPKNILKNLPENQENPDAYLTKSEELLEQFANQHNVGQQIKKSYSNVTPGNLYEKSNQHVHEHGIQAGVHHNRHVADSPLQEGQGQTAAYQNRAQHPLQHHEYSGLTQDHHSGLVAESQDVTQHKTTTLGRSSIADASPAQGEALGLQTSDGHGQGEKSSDQLHKVYFHSPSIALNEHFLHHHSIGRHFPNVHSNSAVPDQYDAISPLGGGQSTQHQAVDPQKSSRNQQAHVGALLPGQQHLNPVEAQTGVSYDHGVLLDNPYDVKSFLDGEQSSVQTYNTQQIDGKSYESSEAEQNPNHPNIAGIVSSGQQSVHIEDTPEVKRAREEHFRIYNQIKANAVQQAQPKAIVLSPNDDVAPVVDKKHFESLEQFQEKLNLQRQRIQEAERLQKEQEQLHFEREREAERLAEERRQMQAELIHFKEEEKKRAAMDKLLETAQLQKQFSPAKNYNENAGDTGSNANGNNEMLEQLEQKQQYLNHPNADGIEVVQNFPTQHKSINKSRPASEYQSAVQSQSNTFQESQKAVHESLTSQEGTDVEKNSTITSKDC